MWLWAWSSENCGEGSSGGSGEVKSVVGGMVRVVDKGVV